MWPFFSGTVQNKTTSMGLYPQINGKQLQSVGVHWVSEMSTGQVDPWVKIFV